MIISLTMTCLVVVTFARTLRHHLVLMCKKDLFRFQLKFLDLLTDLGESLLIVLVIAIGHLVGGCYGLPTGVRLFTENQRKLKIEILSGLKP